MHSLQISFQMPLCKKRLLCAVLTTFVFLWVSILTGLVKNYLAINICQNLPLTSSKTTTYMKIGVKRFSERRVQDVSCYAILNNDKSELEKAKAFMTKYVRKGISDKNFIDLTKDCNTYKNGRQFGNYEISAEEREFSIAYSILLYKEVEQAERLLRAIYSPANIYCFHVDADSKPDVHRAVHGIAKCFDNVFVVSKKEFVVYEGFTRLQADINCMTNLLERGKNWKYFINLPSQQFPLKTNRELVQILNIYNGANDIEGLTGERMLPKRFTFRHVYKYELSQAKPEIYQTDVLKDNPPFNISVVKGSAYGVFSREFVEFVIENKIARALLDWFRDVLSPDEYYWATLQYNPQIETPGSFYKGKPDNKPWFAVYAQWGNPCHGQFVRGVCVFGIGDLHLLIKRNELFANKFYLDYQYLALECLEEWHLNRTAMEHLNELNITFYQALPFIRKSMRK